jgi:5'-methylthioadenosine/S-adenosylhomocysteine nucleosidase
MKNILFICALNEEKTALTNLLGALKHTHHLSKALNVSVEQYQHQDLTIYVSESGMGSVNAASKLAIILQHFNIDQILLIGVGGALHSSLEIGDMLVTDQVIQHDYYSSLAQGDYLMRPGDLILDPEQSNGYNPVLASNGGLFPINQLKHTEINIVNGIIASGSEFVGTSERKNAIHQRCQKAMLVDMEACAIATIANQSNIPFVVAKTVSDKLHADGSISQDFSQFLVHASRNAAIIAQLILDLINTHNHRT